MNNKYKLTQLYTPRFVSGFSLIELMIAMVIGLIATVVIMQTMAGFEGDKRGTTGTSDSQTNANISLFSIAREVKQAGYGLMSMGEANTADSALDCENMTLNGVVNSINPITIQDGGNNSDTITIRYGTSDFGGALSSLKEDASGGPTDVQSRLACAVGDVALVLRGQNCSVTTVTALNAAGSAPSVTFAHSDGQDGDDFACVGEWREVGYAVSNGNLVRDNDVTDATPGDALVADVVNIQAQYGVSPTAGSNQITQWVNATSIAGGMDWSAPTLAMRKRIKALRIAVVARNPNIEPDVVTNACSSTTAVKPTGLCAWEGKQAGNVGGVAVPASPAPAINLAADPDWRRYHYSVYESIIPMRNAIWARATL